MKKHISKLLVCCLALGAILIPTASAAEGIYEDFITVERMQTACGREIQVISVFPRHGSETVEDKLKALAELDFQQGKLCA